MKNGLKISNKVNLTVNEAELIAISILPADPVLEIGEDIALKADGWYSDDSKSDITNEVLWESSDESVAQVDNAGNVTIIDAGSAVITAEFNSVIGFKNLSVE